MRRSIGALILLVLLFTPNVTHAQIPERRQRELVERLQDRYSHVDDLNSEEREFVLKWILSEIDHPNRVDPYRYTMQLLELGHQPTIQRFALDYPALNNEQSRAMQDPRQPRLLPIIAKVLSKTERAILPQTSDVTLWPASIGAATLMLEILSRSREIPGDVRTWAAEVLRDWEFSIPKSEHLRTIVRQWWKENAEACEKHDFASLKPGLPFKVRDVPTPVEEPARDVLSVPTPAPQNSSSATAQSAIAPSSSSSALWLSVAAGLILILAAGLWLVSRRS